MCSLFTVVHVHHDLSLKWRVFDEVKDNDSRQNLLKISTL